MEMAWIYLIAACILEPIWVVFLDKSDNFKRIGWSIATIVAVLSCLFLLSLAVIDIGPGVAYSILAGIGAIGTVVAGALLYKDPVNGKMVFFLSLIVIGVIGIRLMSGGA
ncbi:MAG: multidrug efflux SMR transporter [Thermoplasmata archaeon]|nr:multidrug efflux SMR transporter [Thermoplasmata archaeon]